DTIGPTLSLTMGRLKTDKLTDLECRLHGLFLKARAGLPSRRNPTHSNPIYSESFSEQRFRRSSIRALILIN
ncbi:hypothetical protein, partial [Microvirga tunisiensis]|uniref:hypothetical protein n=1 Tax=Microvirga tunisiensis TaxID=2108360 RepID=UPI001AEDC956